MTWRCRLDSETMSSSTAPSVPTPAAARYIRTGAPRPPAPITSTDASFSAVCPGPPTSRTTIWIRPALQKPEDTANAMGQAERLTLQSDLAWVGQYNGAITGDVSERMVNAIKEFQKSRGGKQTGVLNPQERGILADTARRKQESVGWKIQTDPGTGVRHGIPTKLVPQPAHDANGTTLTSPTGTIQTPTT